MKTLIGCLLGMALLIGMGSPSFADDDFALPEATTPMMANAESTSEEFGVQTEVMVVIEDLYNDYQEGLLDKPSEDIQWNNVADIACMVSNG